MSGSEASGVVLKQKKYLVDWPETEEQVLTLVTDPWR